MKIGIDARFWGLEHAGIGRYVVELVKHLSQIDKKNQYLLFLRKKYFNQINLPLNFSKIAAEVNHYSLEEQWLLAEIFSRENLDLLHVPHFNVPWLYKHPFVVTIHDLLWHEVKGRSVTTQNSLAYLYKYLGYRLVVRRALNKSKAILVPSQTIKNKLIKNHKLNSNNIFVTYEAPSKNFFKPKQNNQLLLRYKIKKPFILYVGSAYPHKNIIKVVMAVKLLSEKNIKLTFVISSSRNVFLDRLQADIIKLKAQKLVKIIGFVTEENLPTLMQHSVAQVQPSLSEGFGLTGLEAMAAGTALVASNSEIFQEIYKDAALFIDPHSPDDIAEKIKSINANQKLRKTLIQKGKDRVKAFNWKTLAQQTLSVYEKVVKS